ncbi:MAG: hypothetical protein IJ652_05080 [Bacteroidales bacterium]|nr:hypothetical protein [Bacteroidales bacterium]
MLQGTTFNPTQRHLLQMFEYNPSESILKEIRSVLLEHFAKKAQQGIDKFWDENEMTPQDVESILKEHLRTPYQHGE